MRLPGFVLCCFLVVFGLHAQHQKVLVGEVFADEVQLSDINVQNTTKKIGAVTNAYGSFQIPVSPGDTLRFTSVQIKTKIIVIDAAIYRATRLRIPLDPFVNELEGVTLNPYGLSKVLSEDLAGLNINTPVDAKKLNLPNAEVEPLTQSQRLLFEATSGAGLIPLNPLLNALSGRTKMLKNRIALEAKNTAIDNVIQRYEEPLFKTYLGIMPNEILRFLYFCESDDSYAQLIELNDELQFLEFLKTKSNEFKQLHE